MMSDYGRIYRPLNERIIQLADKAPAHLANEASIDVGLSYDKAKGIMNRNLSRMGVSPESGRFAGLQQQWGLARAAAEAGAKTRAKRRAEDVRLERLMSAAGLGAQFPRLAASTFGAGGSMYRGLASDYGSQAYDQSASAAYEEGLGGRRRRVIDVEGSFVDPAAQQSARRHYARLQDEIDSDVGGGL